MSYTVKGITFTKEELSLVSIDELISGKISLAHLFIFVAKKPFLLLKAGEYIEKSFIEKYKAKGIASFYALTITDKNLIDNFKTALIKIKNSKTDKEKRESRDELFITLSENYWEGSEKKSFLNFSIACFDSFYQLESSTIETLQSFSMTLYYRSLVSSAISVIVSLGSDYLDYSFIKDIYNCSFILDIGLADSDCSYRVLQACEEERANPGSGILYLEKERCSDPEKTLFLKHPEKSIEIAEALKDFFVNSELIDCIFFHHEQSNGRGFPKGIPYSGTGKWEVILRLADYMVPFKEPLFTLDDGESILKNNFLNLDGKKINDFSLNFVLKNVKKKIEWAHLVQKKEVA